jgi:hypothetical protein
MASMSTTPCTVQAKMKEWIMRAEPKQRPHKRTRPHLPRLLPQVWLQHQHVKPMQRWMGYLVH